MRRTIAMRLGLLAILAAAAPPSFSQTIIENPATPLAENAGRVVTPTEVLAISDEGTSDYYFKWPREVRIAPDGSLLVIDEGQALHFDKDGGFIRNLFKKGQGPGEMQFALASLGTGKTVVVHGGPGNKLITFDAAGKFDKEMSFRTEGRTRATLLHHLDGTFYFVAEDFPRTTGDPDIVDNPRTIVAVGEAGGPVKSLATFVTRAWVVTSGGGGGMFDVTVLIAVPFQDKFLALTHTEEYLIKLYSPAANTVVREFRRAYVRVEGAPLTEGEKKGGLRINGKHYTRPERKYENDIKNILVRDDEIWAVTSTKNKGKGALIDVFDGEGTYRDAFYLKLPDAGLKSLLLPGQCAFGSGHLWVVERTEDGTFVIRKYRLAPSRPEGLSRYGDSPGLSDRMPGAAREPKEDEMRSNPRSRP